jgi:hypothetical protein
MITACTYYSLGDEKWVQTAFREIAGKYNWGNNIKKTIM